MKWHNKPRDSPSVYRLPAGPGNRNNSLLFVNDIRRPGAAHALARRNCAGTENFVRTTRNLFAGWRVRVIPTVAVVNQKFFGTCAAPGTIPIENFYNKKNKQTKIFHFFPRIKLEAHCAVRAVITGRTCPAS